MSWILRIASVQGQRTPLPFLKSVEVFFPDRSDLKNTLLAKQPFFLIRETLKTRPFKMTLKLNLSDGCACGCPCPTIEWPVDFQAPVRTFNHKKDVVFRNLREEAVCNSCSGQFAAIERMTHSDPKTDIRVFAFVTSLLRHNESVKPLAFEVVPESTGHILKRHNADIANNRSPKRQKRKAIVKASDEEPSMDLVLSDFKVPSRTKKAKEKLEARHLDKEIEYERKSESSYVAEPLEKTPLLRESDLSRGSFCDDPDELQDLKDIEVTYQYETAEPLQMEIFGNPSQEPRVNYAVTECLEPVGDHTTEKFVSREQPNLGTEPLKQPKLEGMTEISKSYRENSPNRDVILHQFEYPDHFLPILRDAAKKMIDTLVARLSSESIVENFGSLSQDIRAICHIIKSCPEEIQKLEEILQILMDKELEVATFSSELRSLEEKVKFLEGELLRAKETKAACLQRSTESKSSVKDIREKLIENVRRIVD